MGASLTGFGRLYGNVPGGQAEYLRVPQAHYGAIPVPDDGKPDERYLYLSDVVPTAWQAVEYASIPDDGTVVVLGLGPIGQTAARIALHRCATLRTCATRLEWRPTALGQRQPRYGGRAYRCGEPGVIW